MYDVFGVWFLFFVDLDLDLDLDDDLDDEDKNKKDWGLIVIFFSVICFDMRL